MVLVLDASVLGACVIKTISFFNGRAYPTEVSLQLQLREAVLQTRGNAAREYLSGMSVL